MFRDGRKGFHAGVIPDSCVHAETRFGRVLLDGWNGGKGYAWWVRQLVAGRLGGRGESEVQGVLYGEVSAKLPHVLRIEHLEQLLCLHRELVVHATQRCPILYPVNYQHIKPVMPPFSPSSFHAHDVEPPHSHVQLPTQSWFLHAHRSTPSSGSGRKRVSQRP